MCRITFQWSQTLQFLFQMKEAPTEKGNSYNLVAPASKPLKCGQFYSIQWKPFIPIPWNEDTSVYSGTLYSNTLKWGHICLQWNPSIIIPWNEDTSVYSGTPLFQYPEMKTPLYNSGTPPLEMKTPLYNSGTPHLPQMRTSFTSPYKPAP